MYEYKSKSKTISKYEYKSMATTKSMTNLNQMDLWSAVLTQMGLRPASYTRWTFGQLTMSDAK